MAHHYFGFLVLISCLLLEVTSMPANQDETSTLNLDFLKEDYQPYREEREEKFLPQEQVLTEVQDDTTREIMEKIRAINDALKKPPKRQQVNWNNQPHTGGAYIMDKEILEKLQQIIASGKLHGLPEIHKHQEATNSLNDIRYSRQMNLMHKNQMPIIPMPYNIMNFPILFMPPMNYMADGYPTREALNSIEAVSYQTRQNESPSPFQFQWPFAPFFPMIVRDPLLSLLNGGGWSNFIEYGQSADVCNRKQKAINDDIDNQKNTLEDDVVNKNNDVLLDPINISSSRVGRAIRKRTVSEFPDMEENENTKLSKKLFSITRATSKKPAKQSIEDDQNSKTNVDEVRLHLPFANFGWFGNKKLVSPPPGFYINKLKVRKGGVAIAGPGGVATAGKGGAAIVGPGGLAYTQPGGLAVAGPAARVVALSNDVDLTSVVSRIQQQATIDGSVPQLLQAIPEGKVVATGPVIYYHPKQQTSTVHYIPFYGGGKGQYLEVIKNSLGKVTSEKIVSEDKISSEVVKNTNENLLAKLLAANLQNLRSITNNLLKLHNLGRKTGYLGNPEKVRYRTQLSSLAEAASNSIKLVEDIGDNVDALFKKNPITRQYGEIDDDGDDEIIDENYSDDGIGVEVPQYTDDNVESTIAEAKPYGLAVIGKHGLAASRPVGTAIAASGVALARPIGTAIAGIDPTYLGLDYHLNQFSKH